MYTAVYHIYIYIYIIYTPYTMVICIPYRFAMFCFSRCGSKPQQIYRDSPVNPHSGTARMLLPQTSVSERWAQGAADGRFQKHRRRFQFFGLRILRLASTMRYHLFQSTCSFAGKVQDLHCPLRSGQTHMW